LLIRMACPIEIAYKIDDVGFIGFYNEQLMDLI